jgi:hypothetical protein
MMLSWRYEAQPGRVGAGRAPSSWSTGLVMMRFLLGWLLRWSWEQAKLRHLVKSIRNPPVLDDLPILEAANIDHGDRK